MIFDLANGLGRHLRDTLARAYRSSFQIHARSRELRAWTAGCCEPRQFAQSAPHSNPLASSTRAVRVPSPHAQTWPVEAKPSPAIFSRELAALAAHLRATDPEFHAEEINRLTGVSDAS
jgi:hypothetical protein